MELNKTSLETSAEYDSVRALVRLFFLDVKFINTLTPALKSFRILVTYLKSSKYPKQGYL